MDSCSCFVKYVETCQVELFFVLVENFIENNNVQYKTSGNMVVLIIELYLQDTNRIVKQFRFQ